MIDFDSVTVRFGDFVALPEFTLTVEEGEFFTLLGPSGCGKSTALRTLAGLTTPDSGTIRIDGRDVTRVAGDRRGLGMVFQNYALFPSMSAGDNIEFGLRTTRIPKTERRERVERIAREVDLSTEQLNKNVAQLSGGQQQRVAIARSLVLRPKILLLDEPLSNLDAALRQQLRVQLKDLQRQFGITSVYVTHDQDEALSMSDRIGVMRAGRLEQVGAPREIYAHSATEFVCTFVGDAVRLSPAAVAQIDAGASVLDPAHAGYVRVERIGIAPADGPLISDGARIQGTAESVRYHGTHNTYAVSTAHGDVRVLRADDRAMIAPGDAVTLVIDPADVLQYPGTERAA
ncbi:ABC transporter [Tsukamurella pulmonis]|nr:ABC transporter [Tsukamurella pulmonis]RDH10744.1 ABC transporter ATP-binding protein [Tsukamurella pulmonis]